MLLVQRREQAQGWAMATAMVTSRWQMWQQVLWRVMAWVQRELVTVKLLSPRQQLVKLRAHTQT